MKRIDNKGFAITGTLYSILIFFILILLSFLSVLSTKKDFYDDISEDTKNYLEMSVPDTIEEITLNSTTTSYITLENAKYRFELQGFSYEIYLPKDVTIGINGNPVSTVTMTKNILGENITTNVINYDTSYKVIENDYYKFLISKETSSVTDRTKLVIKKILK